MPSPAIQNISNSTVLESKKSNLEEIVKYSNCRLIRNGSLIVDDLWVRGGKILNPEKLFYVEHAMADRIVNCGGKIIAPGFIELQINGAFGIDFSSPSINDEEIEKVAQGLLSHGVTSFCPTIVTSKPHVYKQILQRFKRTDGGSTGAGILGLHLEGPFISKEKKGAHDIECITDISNGIQGVHDVYGSLENVSIITLAPELPGAMDVIKELTSSGITVSLGHSMSNLAVGEAAVEAGARFITHLFNAMLPFHHRDPHLVGLLSSHSLPDRDAQLAPVHYGMISDGIHTHPAALRIAYMTHPTGLVLVTDAVAAMGLPPGTYGLGPQTVEVLKDGRAVISGTEILCGSVATMDQCVQYFLKNTGCSIVEAIECATLHPAKLLQITNKKGTLEYNTDADFVILEEDLSVSQTYIAGQLVWKKSS